jgi:hypothetical protein
MKEYLETHFTFIGDFGKVKAYRESVQGKGTVTVEYNTESNTAEIIHVDHSRREFFYEAANAKDLKDTVEYCLGPLISDREWSGGVTQKDGSDWDSVDQEDIYDDAV